MGMRLGEALVDLPGQARLLIVRQVPAEDSAASIWLQREGPENHAAAADLVAESAADGVPCLVCLNRHLGDEGKGGWHPPSPCPVPRRVISGRLLHPGTGPERM